MNLQENIEFVNKHAGRFCKPDSTAWFIDLNKKYWISGWSRASGRILFSEEGSSIVDKTEYRDLVKAKGLPDEYFIHGFFYETFSLIELLPGYVQDLKVILNMSHYPHTCPKCSAPAYIRFNNTVDCSGECK